MSDANKATALRFVEALSTNDAALAKACFAPGGVAVAMGTTSFAGTRTAEMMAAGVEAFKTLLPGGLKFTVLSVTAEGERVVVEAQGGASTADGTPYPNRYCMVLTMRDALIAEANMYFCTKLAEDVLWPRAQRIGVLGETAG